MGAGTFHPATTLRALGPRPWKAAFVQPSRRPTDGRYGENPNRLQHYYQYQVILKPAPENVQELYLDSLKAIGLDPEAARHPLCRGRLGKPHPGRLGPGLGSLVRRDGDHPVHLFPAGGRHRLRSGLGRDSPMASSVWRCMCRMSSSSTTSTSTSSSATAKCSHQNEQEFSAYNFERADTEILFQHFKDAEKQCRELLDGKKLALPAYDQCIKASHAFNLLDARGVISVTERAAYIGAGARAGPGLLRSLAGNADGRIQAPHRQRGAADARPAAGIVQRGNSRPHAGRRGARSGTADGGRAVGSRLAVRRHQGVRRTAAADPGDSGLARQAGGRARGNERPQDRCAPGGASTAF